MLEEIKTLTLLAELGSIKGAAERLYLTPSAVTRQLQRLEADLRTPLLDRRVKPPRLTVTGHRVVEQSRSILQQLDAMKASVSSSREPEGPIRIGLAYALANQQIIDPIRSLTARFSKLRPRLTSALSPHLRERVNIGELDAALVLQPDDPETRGSTIARDQLVIVRKRRRGRKARIKSPSELSDERWILNPEGCLVREAIKVKLLAAGLSLSVAAELHDLALQMSLVTAGMGMGIFPYRIVKRSEYARELEIVEHPALSLSVAIAFIKNPALGPLEAAAKYLEAEFTQQLSQ